MEPPAPAGIEPQKSHAGFTQEDEAMQVNLSGHHVEITPALRTYVEKKLARVLRHCDRVIDAQCTLTVEKMRHAAESTVRLAGRQARRTGPPPQGKDARSAGGTPPPWRRTVALTGKQHQMRLIVVSGL